MTTLTIGLGILAIVIFIAAVIFGIKRFANPNRISKKYANSDERNNVFIKKYKEADIAYYQGPAVRLGFIAVLVMLIFAFNYSKTEKSEKASYDIRAEEIIEQDIPVTNQIKPKLPPPPPPPPQIIVVQDEEVIEAEPVFEETEVNIDDEIEIYDDTSSNIKVEIPVVSYEPEAEETEIFVVVERMPEFPGGEQELIAYLSSNITYPAIAQENTVQGTVVVRFVVDERGGISDILIVKDIGSGCGNEAVRVVREMPKWQPGYQRGKAVKVYFTLPVRFKLH